MTPIDEFRNQLRSEEAVPENNDSDSIRDVSFCRHFGHPQQEYLTAQSAAVVVPLNCLRRLKVEGNDRVRFLHNFCTNDIKELSERTWCEAFFVDVKAHVIAHGFVAAFEDHHEILMVGGDSARLAQHLNRYVITEDVRVMDISEQVTGFAVIGPGAADIIHAAGITTDGDSSSSAAAASVVDDRLMIATRWADTPMLLISDAIEASLSLWSTLRSAGAAAAGAAVFTHLRIQERFPIVGIDIDSSVLAPEADRNDSAISHRKGCYLGQEPIARIDAIGHVNRKLYRATATPIRETTDPPKTALPVVSSISEFREPSFLTLILLPIRNVSAGLPLEAITKQHEPLLLADFVCGSP
ncbi:MAG: hypothetical protein KDA81_07390 [Planctomycetaceae bacterium]|nr:hypothetical protein [Planctomycetaceae bacterium]